MIHPTLKITKYSYHSLKATQMFVTKIYEGHQFLIILNVEKHFITNLEDNEFITFSFQFQITENLCVLNSFDSFASWSLIRFFPLFILILHSLSSSIGIFY